MSIKINDNFELLHPSDDGFVVDDSLVRGGFSVANNIAERDAIPLSARKIGMIVYVLSEDVEYVLDGSTYNSSWELRNYDKLELPRYAKTDSPSLTGFPTFTNEDYQLSGNITDINPEPSVIPAYSNSNYDFLRMSKLTTDDMQYAVRGARIKGVTSGAIADVLEGLKIEGDNGMIIPSLSSYNGGSDEPFRDGVFITGENIIVIGGPAYATADEHILNKNSGDKLYLSERGGIVRGQLSTIPSITVELANKTTKPVVYRHLGLISVEVLLNGTGGPIHDLDTLQDGADLLINGDLMHTKKIIVRHEEAVNGLVPCSIWFDIEYNGRIDAGMTIEPANVPYAPFENEHLTTKQYVDRRTSSIELDMAPGHWSNNVTKIDPKTGQETFVYQAFIPTTLIDDRWPKVRMFRAVTTNQIEYHEVNNDDVYRVVIIEAGIRTLVTLECWGQIPEDMKVIIN